jgi:hypothetical protein
MFRIGAALVTMSLPAFVRHQRRLSVLLSGGATAAGMRSSLSVADGATGSTCAFSRFAGDGGTIEVLRWINVAFPPATDTRKWRMERWQCQEWS